MTQKEGPNEYPLKSARERQNVMLVQPKGLVNTNSTTHSDRVPVQTVRPLETPSTSPTSTPTSPILPRIQTETTEGHVVPYIRPPLVKDWTVSDVTTYLEEVGIDYCTDLFIREEISGKVFLVLTDDDLREFSLTLGKRKSILIERDKLKVFCWTWALSRSWRLGRSDFHEFDYCQPWEGVWNLSRGEYRWTAERGCCDVVSVC
eukprot:TRINITY_DN9216_c0_g1_i1.p1 TRINITY_DN9216_c0_g1~~TRINITY_DN9216_c0_g1_i1.p1  ORF type:complete len:204 (-),score=31.35 TRINITY_DN9216_c0_g1_i1:579-1190(-)